MQIDLSDHNTCPVCYAKVEIIDDSGYPTTEVDADSAQIDWHCTSDTCAAQGHYDIDYRQSVAMHRNDIDVQKTPVCDKLTAVRRERSAILEFLEFLRGNGIQLMERKKLTYKKFKRLLPMKDDEMVEAELEKWCIKDTRDDDLVYQFFDIDPDELEEERRVLLEFQRKLHVEKEKLKEKDKK